VAESFERECAAPDRNIERWKQAMKVVKELEGYEITELWQGETLRALRLTCVVSGETLEALGLWTP
jgi:heme-degrading monooxygenase HmoA